MVCYLKGLGNKKPPEGGLFEFEVNSCTHRELNSPMCIGNTEIEQNLTRKVPVYPYVYRGTPVKSGRLNRYLRFIPMCIGNTWGRINKNVYENGLSLCV